MLSTYILPGDKSAVVWVSTGTNAEFKHRQRGDSSSKRVRRKNNGSVK